MAAFQNELADWKNRSAGRGSAKDDPEPKPSRLIVADATIEALAVILSDNPGGVLLARDELSGWLRSFDRYASRGGGDIAAWLSMHSGEPLTVDRKTSVDRTIFVPNAAVGICGGIQPGVLQRCLSGEHSENGLAARLLLAFPPRRPKRWTDSSVPPSIMVDVQNIVDRLAAARFKERQLTLSPEALREFRTFYDQHALELVDLQGVLAAAFSKLEEVPARLAISLQCIQETDSTVVSGETMRASIQLTEWFKRETLRVHAILAESPDDQNRRRLVEWIQHRGGTATERDAQRGPRWLREPGVAEQMLAELVRGGVGEWEPIEPAANGGRSSRRFRLRATGDKTRSNGLVTTGDGDKTSQNTAKGVVLSPSPLSPQKNDCDRGAI